LIGSVADEKLIRLKDISTGLNCLEYIIIIEVLAVPEPPTSSVLRRPFSFLSLLFSMGRLPIDFMMKSVRVESIVGISS